MTALLTDNLPLLAGAPNGIKKLRELILELAVRGKLVPQDPRDEPASELLKRIAEEKARLVAEGKIKRQKPLQEIAEDEWPFVLPVGWEWSRLGDVSEYIQRGKGPVYVDQSSFRVVSQKCVRWSGLDLQPARFIAPESLVKYESIRFLRSGDILWNSTGTGTIGRACVVEDCSEEEQLVADSHVTVVRPTGILPVFLWRWIQSPSVQSELEGNASGTTNQIELNTSTVIAHLTPIPPLAEQHRIIAKVDELMALCDRLEAQQADAVSAHAQLVQALLDSLTQAHDAEDFAQSWQRLAEHFHTLFSTESSIDALKQTLLQLAVMGKLTNSEILSHLPIQDVARLIDGDRGKNYPKSHDYLSEGYCLFLSTKNVRDGCFEFNDRQFISEEKHKTLRNGKLERGDVVITTRGTLGNVAWYSNLIPYERIRINSGMLIIRCNSEIIYQAFLVRYLQSPVFGRQLQDMRTGSAQPQIPAGILKKFLVPIFSIQEQHRIVAKVDQLMALCDQLKARLNQARQVHEQLANALVEQAVA